MGKGEDVDRCFNSSFYYHKPGAVHWIDPEVRREFFRACKYCPAVMQYELVTMPSGTIAVTRKMDVEIVEPQVKPSDVDTHTGDLP